MDKLRLGLAQVGREFALEVYVNDVEMTEAGAGLGMDPHDLLLPTNQLIAVPEPRTVPIARCECGTYGTAGRLRNAPSAGSCCSGWTGSA